MRLNRGAVRLTEQELRNCLYRGGLNDLLHELRATQPFLKLLGRDAPHKRMSDAEIVLRYFTLSSGYNPESGKIEKYSGNMRSSLNRFMDSNKKASPEAVADLRDRFTRAVTNVSTVFGANGFRRMLGELSLIHL